MGRASTSVRLGPVSLAKLLTRRRRLSARDGGTRTWLWLPIRLYITRGTRRLEEGHRRPVMALEQRAAEGVRRIRPGQRRPGEHSAVNYGWYAAFLRWVGGGGAGTMSRVISLGELTIGIALILGLFTGIAAFLAGTLSMSFGLAGVAGVNPMFFLLEVLLILAWRNAGYFGLDRYILPALGTPWEPGKLFANNAQPGKATQLA